MRPFLPSIALCIALGLSLNAAPVTAADTHAAHATIPHNSEGVADAMAASALAATDRSDDMRSKDEGRRKEVQFAAMHVMKGYNVIDLGAASGYMSMLLSSFVGPEGSVTAQNPKMWVENFKLGPVMDMLHAARPNITPLAADFDAIPKPAKLYDLAYSSMIYHDTVWMGVDRPKANKALFNALKPGGLYIIVDHQAAAGAGATVTKTVHRIEEKVVISEVKAAGFELIGPHDLLKNPDDDHSKNVFDPAIRGKTDRFVLVFRKPVK
jgi:predicted methyltransferase